MALLEASGIGKNFGDTKVLKDISLTLEQGEALAIIGSSGSGKTTLLRCLNFLETADAGQLVLDGETFDLAHAGRADIARLRKKTAFVFQNYNLFRNKTALQNVTEGLIVARKLPKEQADAIGMKMLDFARKKLPEHDHPTMGVINTNTRAIALYKRMGWRLTGSVLHRYDPADANAFAALYCEELEMRYQG